MGGLDLFIANQGLELTVLQGPGLEDSLPVGPVTAGGRGRAAWELVRDWRGSVTQPPVSSPGNLTSLQGPCELG